MERVEEVVRERKGKLTALNAQQDPQPAWYLIGVT